jgi:sortase (surface protein transpeptidase)
VSNRRPSISGAGQRRGLRPAALALAVATAVLLAPGAAATASEPRVAAGDVQLPAPPAVAPGAVDGERRAPRRIRPRRVVIGKIGVNAPIITLGLNRDRTLKAPQRWGDVGWWQGGPAPGEIGPAVLAGHYDSNTGPAVFYRVRRLREGDLIRIVRPRSTLRFRVQRISTYPKNRFPTRKVYGDTKRAELRLITCAGSFDRVRRSYSHNLVVYAQIEKPKRRARSGSQASREDPPSR